MKKLILILAFLLFASPCFAAIAVVGATNTTGTGTISAAHTGTTGGNGLVIMGATQDILDPNCSMSGATLEGAVTAYNPATADYVWMYLVGNLATGGTKTLVCTGSFASWSVRIIEVSGQDTTTFFDAVSGNVSNNTDTMTTSLTTTVSGAAIFAVAQNVTYGSTATGTGYVQSDPANTATHFVSGEYNLDVGATGSKTVSFAATASNANWTMIAIAVRPATGGGGVGTVIRHRVVR
jgi:hypothetical protein